MLGFFYCVFEAKHNPSVKRRSYILGAIFIFMSVISKKLLVPVSYSDLNYDLIDKIIAIPFLVFLIKKGANILNRKKHF